MLEENYSDNVAYFDRLFRVSDSYDLIKKTVKIGQGEITLYYVDGLSKSEALQKLFIYLVSAFRNAKRSRGFSAFTYAFCGK